MADPEPMRDWLVTFAHKVATERGRQARQPGSVFCLMLRRQEAEGLLAQINELVQSAGLVGDSTPGETGTGDKALVGDSE